MLDMGSSETSAKIVSRYAARATDDHVPATLPPKIRAELAKTILRNPAEVNIAISKPNEAIDRVGLRLPRAQATEAGHQPRDVRAMSRCPHKHLIIFRRSKA